jgi:hypothetical protein
MTAFNRNEAFASPPVLRPSAAIPGNEHYIGEYGLQYVNGYQTPSFDAHSNANGSPYWTQGPNDIPIMPVNNHVDGFVNINNTRNITSNVADKVKIPPKSNPKSSPQQSPQPSPQPMPTNPTQTYQQPNTLPGPPPGAYYTDNGFRNSGPLYKSTPLAKLPNHFVGQTDEDGEPIIYDRSIPTDLPSADSVWQLAGRQERRPIDIIKTTNNSTPFADIPEVVYRPKNAVWDPITRQVTFNPPTSNNNSGESTFNGDITNSINSYAFDPSIPDDGYNSETGKLAPWVQNHRLKYWEERQKIPKIPGYLIATNGETPIYTTQQINNIMDSIRNDHPAPYTAQDYERSLGRIPAGQTHQVNQQTQDSERGETESMMFAAKNNTNSSAGRFNRPLNPNYLPNTNAIDANEIIQSQNLINEARQLHSQAMSAELNNLNNNRNLYRMNNLNNNLNQDKFVPSSNKFDYRSDKFVPLTAEKFVPSTPNNYRNPDGSISAQYNNPNMLMNNGTTPIIGRQSLQNPAPITGAGPVEREFNAAAASMALLNDMENCPSGTGRYPMVETKMPDYDLQDPRNTTTSTLNKYYGVTSYYARDAPYRYRYLKHPDYYQKPDPITMTADASVASFARRRNRDIQAIDRVFQNNAHGMGYVTEELDRAEAWSMAGGIDNSTYPTN